MEWSRGRFFGFAWRRVFGAGATGLFTGLLMTAAAHAQPLKVLTLNFNDEVTVEDRDYRFRDRRFEAIVRWIKQNDPDIVMMQEAFNFHRYSSVVKALAEAIGYDYTYRIGMGAPLVMYDSNGVLAKKKFKMSQRRFAKLPHGAPWIGDGKNWIVVFGAISWAVGTRLTLEDGSPLYVYTTHLIGSTQTDRDDQMWGIDQDIRAHIARNGEDYAQAHVILGGDFNSEPTSPGVRKLLANGYRDSFDDAHPGSDACTSCSDPTSAWFNPMTIAAGEFPTQDQIFDANRIDYVLTHGPGMRTLASTLTFTRPVDGIWMTDHSAVLSTLEVGQSAVDPASVPNPVRDREEPGTLGRIVHVTPGMLDCQAPLEQTIAAVEVSNSSALECELPSLGQVSWEHGVTFINDTQAGITVRVRPKFDGLGFVWAKQQADLAPGRATAYFFDPGQQYVFGVRGGFKSVFGSLQSDAQSEAL